MSDLNLNYSREILISLEANMFSDTIGMLKNLITDINGNITNRLKDIKYYVTGLPEDPKVFFNDLDYLEHTLRNVSYIDVRDALIPIPENFVGNYLDYASRLIVLVRDANKDIEPLLKDYKTLIGSIINNGGSAIILKDYNALYQEAKKSKENIDSVLRDFLSGKKTVDKLGNVLYNLNQLSTLDKSIFSLLSEIKVNDIVKLNKDVEDIHHMLGILLEDIGNQKIILNQKDVSDIGNGAYELASYLESIAILYYSVHIFVNRVKDLYTTVIKKK